MDRAGAATAVAGAGARTAAGGSSDGVPAGAGLSELSTDGGSASSCEPLRIDTSVATTSAATRASTTTTLTRTRPSGRPLLLNVIGDRVYVPTDGERQETASRIGRLYRADGRRPSL